MGISGGNDYVAYVRREVAEAERIIKDGQNRRRVTRAYLHVGYISFVISAAAGVYLLWGDLRLWIVGALIWSACAIVRGQRR